MHYAYRVYIGFHGPIMENQTENHMEHEMESRFMWGCVVDSLNWRTPI